MNYYLCIDYGGTNTKAILFDENGTQVSVSSFSTVTIEKIAGHREIDLAQLWQSLCVAIQEVIQTAACSAEAIRCVATIGHGKGLYVLDWQQQPFMHGILSTDERGNQQAQIFEERLDELWPKTMQHVIGPQAPVLLRWLKENQPATYEKIGYVLSAKDYVRFQLTGEIHQELGDASGNHWVNLETGAYDPEILQFFGIPEMWQALPPLVSYQELVSEISAEAASLTGLCAGTPVIGGLFDIDACALGSGVIDESRFSVVSGTWNINTYPSGTPATKASGQMNSCFPEGRFLIEESSPTSAGNLAIMLKMLMSEEIENVKTNVDQNIYEVLEVFLENTDATYSNLLFFPFLYGSNVHTDATGSLIGLTATSTKSEILRAVYEGIVFAHKTHIDRLLKTLGQRPTAIRLSGGAANSPHWCQMFADILDLPVETTRGTELGGLGGAIACHQAIHAVSLADAVNKMVVVEQTFLPNKQEHANYLKKYQVYQTCLNQLTPVWQDLATIRKGSEAKK